MSSITPFATLEHSWGTTTFYTLQPTQPNPPSQSGIYRNASSYAQAVATIQPGSHLQKTTGIAK